MTAIWVLLFGWMAVSELHWLAWVSLAITVAHTLDETIGEGGPIWEYLQRWFPFPWFAMFAGYVLFQSTVVYLGLRAWTGEAAWIVAFVGQRLFDVFVTHTALRAAQEPNPGHKTAWLLLLDAAFVSGWFLSQAL